MQKRILALFITLLIVFNGLMARVYLIATGDTLAQAAQQQSAYTIELSESRGYIYDCNLVPLVNNSADYKAIVSPVPDVLSVFSDNEDLIDRDLLVTRLEEHIPFTVNTGSEEIYGNGISSYKILDRYTSDTLAPHIIGHLSSEGQGVMGAEAAYNDYLSSHSGNLQVRYVVNAYGEVLMGAGEEQINNNYNDPHGVVLTIDSEIQKIAEEAAEDIAWGSVVVMEVNSGDIKASVSMPSFTPDDIAKDLENPDKPFFNRSYATTAVGSTFKVLVSAVAFERGFNINQSYECTGSIQVGDTVYGCHYEQGHGPINMQTALEVSCNPYFIQLAQDVGVQNIAFKAAQMGFGRESELMPGVYSSAGVLPSQEELRSIGEAANFSFGQGMLSATPIQIAQMMSTIANGGMAVTPRITKGFTNDGEVISEHTEQAVSQRILEEGVAQQVRNMMVSVVENGSGKKAKPYVGGAGGKTSSAQTGMYIDGEEVVHAWFAGFYPIDEPKYAIVVLVEGGEAGQDVAAPIFKEIADRIRFIEG